MKFILPILLIFYSCAYAQSTPEKLTHNFFEVYQHSPSKALDQIYATNPWSKKAEEAIKSVKLEVSRFTEDYVGKYYGYELITKKQFSNTMLVYSYMLKYDRQPVRFTFKFYKPDKKWVFYSFKLDMEFVDEIEQSARIYYMDLDYFSED